ncbi:MAG: hypothetical protein N3B13_06080, partial [Deltaproteobacteria bacterium]|nr:hypothetical protein [Deltaproteobacteria bacterium]
MKKAFLLFFSGVLYFSGCTLEKVRCNGDNNCPPGMICGEAKYCIEPGDTGPDRCWTGDVIYLSPGMFHTCALLSQKNIKCWGNNDSGQIGNGTTEESVSEPSDVLDTGSDIKMISAGGFHTCALRNTGRVLCWGRNDYGQLGNNNTDNQDKPTDVLNLSDYVE